MEIGRRLRELREARNLSQGDIERRTGLIRCYVSRVECGHTIPALGTLEKWAKALDLELYQLFFSGPGQPVAPKSAKKISLGKYEAKLLGSFKEMPLHHRQLLLSLARRMTIPKTAPARWKGKRYSQPSRTQKH